jgi:hypothetical protein
MSLHAARRIVWLALLFLVPLPLAIFGAWIPVTRYLLLAGVCIAMRVAEGPGGVVWQLTAVFLGHALVYAGLLWIVAWLAARALRPLPPSLRAGSVAAGVLCALVWALATAPYVTPFGTAAHANLLGVLR